MQHFGVINKELSRIQVSTHNLPIIKGIPVTCSQCQKEERECEKACPVTPKVIHFDEKTLHMVVDKTRCLGYKCGKCREACPAKIPHFYPPDHDYALVCDLCDTENTGKRDPQCVAICPRTALHFRETATVPRHWFRKRMDEKAELIAKRLYPLTKESWYYPERGL
jgi:Fe-S-cluster-containing hydrogenase component 2